MIDRMIEIVPADTGTFRNVVPKVIEDMLKKHQARRVEQPDLMLRRSKGDTSCAF